MTIDRETIRQVAEQCAIAVAHLDTSGAVSPLASFFARGRTGIVYSTRFDEVPQSPNADAFKSILKLNVADGAPRTWHVRASLRAIDLAANQEMRTDWSDIVCRVSWTIGAFSDVADISFRAGSVCFPLTCDAFEIKVAGFIPGNPSRLEVQTAVAPFPLAGDYRAPVRSVRIVVPDPFAVQNIAVPRHAQQVTLFGEGAFTYSFLDPNGTVVGQATTSETNSPVTVPAGAATISIISAPVPGSPSVVNACFVLGL